MDICIVAYTTLIITINQTAKWNIYNMNIDDYILGVSWLSACPIIRYSAFLWSSDPIADNIN